MKPLFQELPFPIDSHIHFYVEDLPHFIVPWHYHPAIEIMYITSGTGTRFVGDHVEGYFEGDVCMIGPQLPHEWRNDPVYFDKSSGLRATCMYTIAIDLGGTVVKIGLLSDGEIVDCVRLPSRLALGLAPNLPKIKEAIDRLLAAWRIDVAALRCIGLAFPGLVDPIHNRVISTNEKYDDACSISLDKWAWENWEVPFCMDNDARLAVAGEWWQGAARGKNNVVMMTIGTGIGTGVVIDGRLLYGQHFQAGSLGGHFVLDYKGRRCSCGNKGCVEALSSSFFLPTIIREHALLSESFKRDADIYDFKRIFRLAQEGNTDALLIRNECMDIWASAIITYIHAYDPEVVILGGGILKSQEVIIPYISKRVDELAWCPSGKVPIVPAILGDDAALFGLEYFMVKQQQNERICI